MKNETECGLQNKNSNDQTKQGEQSFGKMWKIT